MTMVLNGLLNSCDSREQRNKLSSSFCIDGSLIFRNFLYKKCIKLKILCRWRNYYVIWKIVMTLHLCLLRWLYWWFIVTDIGECYESYDFYKSFLRRHKFKLEFLYFSRNIFIAYLHLIPSTSDDNWNNIIFSYLYHLFNGTWVTPILSLCFFSSNIIYSVCTILEWILPWKLHQPG